MAFDVGSLIAQLKLDQKQFETTVEKAKGGFKKLGGAAKTASLGIAAITAAGAAAGVGLFKLAQSTADLGDKYAKMSQRVGVSVETLSSLDHVAKISGTTLDTVARGVKNLAARSLDVTQGLTESKRAFDALGISVTKTDGSLKSSTNLLLEVSDKLSKLENETEKVALAQEIFGRAGTELLPVLNQGAEGIARLMKESDALGLTWEANTAKTAELFNDNLLRLRGSLRGITNQIGVDLMPFVIQISEKMTNWIANNRELIATKLSEWIHQAWNSLQNLWNLMSEAGPVIGNMIGLLPQIPIAMASNLSIAIGFVKQFLADFTEIQVKIAEVFKTIIPINYFKERHAELLEETIQLAESASEAYTFSANVMKTVNFEAFELSKLWAESEKDFRINANDEMLNEIVSATEEAANARLLVETETTKEISDTQQFAARQTQSVLSGTLKAAILDTKNFSSAMKSIWKSLAGAVIDQIAKMIIELIALESILLSIKTLMGGIFGFGGGGLVAGFGSVGGGAPIAAFNQGGIVGAQEGLITSSPTILPLKAVSETFEPEVTAPLSAFPDLFRSIIGEAGGIQQVNNFEGVTNADEIAEEIGVSIKDAIWSEVG